jgi:hypothetical protein
LGGRVEHSERAASRVCNATYAQRCHATGLRGQVSGVAKIEIRNFLKTLNKYLWSENGQGAKKPAALGAYLKMSCAIHIVVHS